MAMFELKMPKMGESIEEATITRWFVKEGDRIEEEAVLLEIATDKVDSEIPSPVDGVISKILFQEGALVPVGAIIAVVNTSDPDSQEIQKVVNTSDSDSQEIKQKKEEKLTPDSTKIKGAEAEVPTDTKIAVSKGDKFFSPLVRTIA